ncbi:MAG: hypothetical protein AB7S71_15985 [Dongiaceae bacterium]
MMLLAPFALGINVLSFNYVAAVQLKINENNILAARRPDCCQPGQGVA